MSKVNVIRLLPLILVLSAWQIASSGSPLTQFFFGSPFQILRYLVQRSRDGSLPIDFCVTFVEAASGFVIGNCVGTALGLSSWHFKRAFDLMHPYVVALGSAPIFAFAPLLIVWFGTGMFSKIMVATLSTVFVALSQAYAGANEVSGDYLRLMKTFDASRNQTFRKIIAPSSIVWVVSAFRLNVGFAILGAFIGEFISSDRGLGHLILVASGLFDISLVFCGVILMTAMAFILYFIIEKLEAIIRRGVVVYL